ncbi:hypothetical protein RRG08_007973 [Elysia crispata]|uniref:Uncharacterized protein n=1 Tax=Elysia crispata TaxID=231223 RepID=A0AAE0ZR75_9GAST|nr:hypothetical protein RRG08_007973 [Elysia crispata]
MNSIVETSLLSPGCLPVRSSAVLLAHPAGQRGHKTVSFGQAPTTRAGSSGWLAAASYTSDLTEPGAWTPEALCLSPVDIKTSQTPNLSDLILLTRGSDKGIFKVGQRTHLAAALGCWRRKTSLLRIPSISEAQ